MIPSETKTLNYFVNGKSTPSQSGQSFEIFDPSTGKVIAKAPRCTAEEVIKTSELGPLVTESRRTCVTGCIEKGIEEGAQLVLDSRSVFAGHKKSFFGDLHALGKDGVRFYTESKCVTSFWFDEAERRKEKLDTWDGMLGR